MFKKICVAVDNSPSSDACCAAAVSLARAFGGQIVGSHVYAVRMHERRFRQMEATHLGETQRASHFCSTDRLP